MTIANWADELEAADIETGDEITLETESEIADFDGEATVVAASEPNSNYWLEIEGPGDADVFVVPDSDSEGGARLVQGQVRATGHIANEREIATVHGIKSEDEPEDDEDDEDDREIVTDGGTKYADEYGYETADAADHDLEPCPNCGSDRVAENTHGTADEIHVECAGCGRARGAPLMPTLEDLQVDDVEETVNDLLQQGLSPAEAWNYYGVEIKGLSQTEWGDRTGKDQSTISKAITRAKRKLGES